MNNAKMWLVVSPTVGVPLFLGAVAVGSFAVHLQVVKNTSWVADFLQGVPMGTGDKMAAAAIVDESAMKAATVSYAVPAKDGLEVTVILPDGTQTQAILKDPQKLQASDL
ncbi:light-harvesting protein B-800-850 alpha chain [Planktotalea frisia]|jgi:light-harvesting protein B-800-850 alpha chain|uniref:Light-harvesting protein B-800/850 alpha chain n=1 Tax=Planktotalea frisia TaxID=696762 RepID=A0A1L9NTT3_9RHOB|nr:light-harvesting protein [Planktotalea frisia]OJI92720.1 light-harvesting protein B-800/850 alpha chain [Planktotalea frisia]PZX24521.1 light-harvesting protein B-800-850 alpha chain [Planktotalea frisia]